MRAMINIPIHQFQLGGGVVDEAALEQFQKQWATYRNLVDADAPRRTRRWAAVLHGALGRAYRHAVRLSSTSPAATPAEIAAGARRHRGQVTTTASILSEPALELGREQPRRACPSRSSSTIATSVDALTKRPESGRCRVVRPVDPPPLQTAGKLRPARRRSAVRHRAPS